MYIQMNMHEQINIDNQFQFKLLASFPPSDMKGRKTQEGGVELCFQIIVFSSQNSEPEWSEAS